MTSIETTQIHRVWIKATPERIWEAITSPEWTDRYGYGGVVQYDDGLTPGSAYRTVAGPEMVAAGFSGTMLEGEILESDPPRRLVLTWKLLMDPTIAAEGSTRITYELAPAAGGATRLTVTHELDEAPSTIPLVNGSMDDTGAGGGWAWVLSDLKSLLETGTRLAG